MGINTHQEPVVYMREDCPVCRAEGFNATSRILIKTINNQELIATLNIVDSDLKIDVYRSGGAGGQSVNTTDSAVRITHLPTNTVVTCQNERSQLQNKLQAMKVLKSRLYEIEMEKKRAEQDEVEASKKKIEWGSQIRSYVLHPYKMVKDHRTDFESSQAEKVLDGDLDGFMDAHLRWMVQGSVEE